MKTVRAWLVRLDLALVAWMERTAVMLVDPDWAPDEAPARMVRARGGRHRAAAGRSTMQAVKRKQSAWQS